MSIAEVVVPGGERWEFQLKGSGPTPFCRGADGRAVLRCNVDDCSFYDQASEFDMSMTGITGYLSSRSERRVIAITLTRTRSHRHRSSVREFLASEAMHHLGVPTTRALSLIASTSASVERQWCVER